MVYNTSIINIDLKSSVKEKKFQNVFWTMPTCWKIQNFLPSKDEADTVKSYSHTVHQIYF